MPDDMHDLIRGVMNFADLASHADATRAGALDVEIESISEDPAQPRASFDAQGLQELAATIREHGVLQPLLIRPGEAPGRYTLIAGARRFRAAKLAGLGRVPARVIEGADVPTVQIIENLQRADLTPLEMADAVEQLVRSMGSQAPVARKLGKSKAWVSQYVALATLSPASRAVVEQRGCADFTALSRLMILLREDEARTLATLATGEGPITRAEVLGLERVQHAELGVSTSASIIGAEISRPSGVQHAEPVRPADSFADVGVGSSRAEAVMTVAPAPGQDAEPAKASRGGARRPAHMTWAGTVNGEAVEVLWNMHSDEDDEIWVRDRATGRALVVKAADIRLTGWTAAG